MRNTIFGRRGLPWALAAVLALSLPATRSLPAAESSPSSLLQAQLPPGVALRRASSDQMFSAVRAAVKAHPTQATSIVQTAILVHRHAIDFKDRDPKDGPADCGYVRGVTRAAIASDPDQASDITQMALSLAPDCADALNSAVTDPLDPNALNGVNSPNDLYGGFGVGFGPGFPGSPGFTGSTPSGAIALPPVQESPTVG